MYRIIVNEKRVAEISSKRVAHLVYDWYVERYDWVLLNEEVRSGPAYFWISRKSTPAVMKGEDWPTSTNEEVGLDGH
jgi:hypothetical protein